MDYFEREEIITKLRLIGFKRIGRTPRTKYLLIAYKYGVEKALEELETDYYFKMLKSSTYWSIKKALKQYEEMFKKEKETKEEDDVLKLFEDC